MSSELLAFTYEGSDNGDCRVAITRRNETFRTIFNPLWLAPGLKSSNKIVKGGDQVDYCCTCQRGGNP